jgi:DNA-directed RNA polymerase
VLLDASCNRIQHLSAILQDLELGIKVNLVTYNDETQPRDIYSELIEPINKAINSYGEKNIEYSNLSIIKLDRKIIKYIVMTKVYNVTLHGISDHLKSKFIKIENEDITEEIVKEFKLKLGKKSNYYKAPGKNPLKKYVYLTGSDIYKIASIVNEQIFVLFPSLNNIYNYFIEINKIVVKLGITLT